MDDNGLALSWQGIYAGLGEESYNPPSPGIRNLEQRGPLPMRRRPRDLLPR